MKEIVLAESAGFCFGVNRSVSLAEQMLDQYTECYSLGQLIHNDDVVRHFQERGLHVVNTPEEVPDYIARRVHAAQADGAAREAEPAEA